MTAEESRAELRKIAYSSKDFDKVITFIWALPKCFWSDVCKRLIATVIVGVQVEEKPVPDFIMKLNIPSE